MSDVGTGIYQGISPAVALSAEDTVVIGTWRTRVVSFRFPRLSVAAPVFRGAAAPASALELLFAHVPPLAKARAEAAVQRHLEDAVGADELPLARVRM